MTSWLLMNSIFFGIVLTCGILVARWAWLTRQHQQLNELVGKELQEIILSAQKTITREGQKRSIKAHEDLFKPGETPPMDLADPAILSTLVTVLVNKYGNMRLSMQDFEAIPVEEYVSVYVDTIKNEIILSLNHSMISEEPVLAKFNPTDDKTYH